MAKKRPKLKLVDTDRPTPSATESAGSAKKQSKKRREVKARPAPDPTEVSEVQKIFERIRGRRMKGHEVIADNGRDIVALERRLKDLGLFHGNWGALLKDELGISPATAANWKRYSQTYDRLKGTDNFKILKKIEPTFIYWLTAPSVHEDGLKEALIGVEAGEELDEAKVKAIVARHQNEERSDGRGRKPGRGNNGPAKPASTPIKSTKNTKPMPAPGKPTKGPEPSPKLSVGTQVELLKKALFDVESQIEEASDEALALVRDWAHANLNDLTALLLPLDADAADEKEPQPGSNG